MQRDILGKGWALELHRDFPMLMGCRQKRKKRFAGYGKAVEMGYTFFYTAEVYVEHQGPHIGMRCWWVALKNCGIR